MRALFLGSGGRVGTLLRTAWTSKKVTAVWHARHGGDLSFDITGDPDALRKAIANCDVIVNLAGATHHRQTAIGSANTDLARNILDHANGIPVFLISSAAIYGTNPDPLTEKTSPTPTSDYGHDKARMETMAQAHPTKTITLRLGNVAGADALLGTNRPRYVLDMFPDGSHPERSYIGPKALADTLDQLIQAFDTLPDCLNLATPRAVSMADLLRAAGKPWDNTPAKPNAIKRVELNTSLLEAFVKFTNEQTSPEAIVRDWTSVKAAL